jgi:Uma2 family endonuclease
MSTQKTRLTAEEFHRLYSHRDGRYELVDGEVVEMAPVNEQHGDAAFNISGAFYVYSRTHGIGRGGVETGYRVRQNPDTVRGPDVSFNLRSRSAGESPRPGFIPGAPDIAVEVVSPSNTAAEMERKVGEFLAAGSQRVWVVYTATTTLARRVVVHHPNGTANTYNGDDVITDEKLLPGFSLPLADIFD